MTDLVKLAIEQKPEDFKEALTVALSDRLRAALNDKREEMAEGVVNKKDKLVKKEPVVNQDHLTDEKPNGGTSGATAPGATNPGAHPHVQTDEKKSGSKVAKAPVTESSKPKYILTPTQTKTKENLSKYKGRNVYRSGGDEYDGGFVVSTIVNGKEVDHQIHHGGDDFTYKGKTYKQYDAYLDAVGKQFGLTHKDFERERLD